MNDLRARMTISALDLERRSTTKAILLYIVTISPFYPTIHKQTVTRQ